MLDGGGTEGGSPQLMQALQAQQHAQANNSPGAGALGGGMPSAMSHGSPGGGAHPTAPAHAEPPREVGSIAEELVVRPLDDLGKEVKSWFNVNEWFGIKSTDTPEQQQRNQELFSRYQQLDSEQQQRFQARLQREQQRKAQMAEEDRAKAAQKQAQAASSFEAPKGKHDGAVDPNAQSKSRSQLMTNTVTQNRQSFNKLQSSG